MRFDNSWAAGAHHDERLEANVVFQQVATELSTLELDGANLGCKARLPLNLIVYDGANRLYAWNSREKLLLHVGLHDCDLDADVTSRRCLIAPKPPQVNVIAPHVLNQV